MPAFPTQAETIEEERAGRKVEQIERRGLGEVGLKKISSHSLYYHNSPNTGFQWWGRWLPWISPPPSLRALLLFSRWILSDSLRPRGLQHARLPCLSLSPGICSNSCPVELVMLSKHLILFCPILLLSSIFPSIRVFSNESALHIRWSKYWNFSISPSNQYSGLISFRIDWFDLLAVPGTLKVFSSTPIWKHQFFGSRPSLWFNSHIHTRLLEKPYLWLDEDFGRQSDVFAF